MSTFRFEVAVTPLFDDNETPMGPEKSVGYEAIIAMPAGFEELMPPDRLRPICSQVCHDLVKDLKARHTQAAQVRQEMLHRAAYSQLTGALRVINESGRGTLREDDIDIMAETILGSPELADILVKLAAARAKL